MIKRLPELILLSWLLMAAAGVFLPLSAFEVSLPDILERPSEHSFLGRDDLGRSLLDRLVLGARLSFFVALFVILISTLIGVTLGLTAAYFGGWPDRLLTRVIDMFLAFPGILLAIALAGILGPGIENTVIALSAMGWVGFARLTRAQALSLRQREHIQAAIALGTGNLRIIHKHLLPLVAAPIIVEASFGVGSVVIAEAGLSFLGLGVQPPEPSWGSMIRDGVRYMLVAPHMVLVPGVALSLVVLSVNMLGDRLRDYLDVTTVERFKK